MTTRYTQDHEWLKSEADGTVTVGITDYAQGQLGDIVFVELPQVGEHITMKETFGTVESVKAVSDLYAPVSGEVTSINTKLQNAPELINSDPHGEAWLIKVKLTDRSQTDGLMTAEEYEAYVQEGTAH